MHVGLIDVDSHNFPNLALMKISAYHKSVGDSVEWWYALEQYDRVYMSKVFDNTYSPDIPEPMNAKEIIKGGTGYGLENKLPDEIEHIYPDYSLYPELTKDTAYGFLTRGCPRACDFCIVSPKEGRCSKKVADLSEFWNGQKNIKLMDPNILACPEHMDLLGQLANSNSYVDFTQGLDCRLLTDENIRELNHIRVKEIHFAWDYMEQSDRVVAGLRKYRNGTERKPHGAYATVYVLTNHGTSMDDNLFRIYTLRDIGYDPYVMIYDKPNAPDEIIHMQRWVNNRKIFRKCRDFENYMKQHTTGGINNGQLKLQ